MMVLDALLIITSTSLCTQMGPRMVMECRTRRQPRGFELSGARTGRPPSPLVELQVKV